jgi:NADH:ubiquinone oxidoreductase subunit
MTQGNVFYQTRDSKRRWVIYNGEMEASRVSPDWHGWLHFTWDRAADQGAPEAQGRGKSRIRRT